MEVGPLGSFMPFLCKKSPFLNSLYQTQLCQQYTIISWNQKVLVECILFSYLGIFLYVTRSPGFLRIVVVDQCLFIAPLFRNIQGDQSYCKWKTASHHASKSYLLYIEVIQPTNKISFTYIFWFNKQRGGAIFEQILRCFTVLLNLLQSVILGVMLGRQDSHFG